MSTGCGEDAFWEAEAGFLEAAAGLLDAFGEGVTVDATTGALWLVAEIASGDGVATGAALLRGDAARDFADGVF